MTAKLFSMRYTRLTLSFNENPLITKENVFPLKGLEAHNAFLGLALL
jgi:hypothetical protein